MIIIRLIIVCRSIRRILNGFFYLNINPSWIGSPPPIGSYLFLDEKVTKNQGFGPMSDKFVKALEWQHKYPMKNRAERVALGSGVLNISAKALTFSPSIMPEAGKHGAQPEKFPDFISKSSFQENVSLD